MNSCGNFESSSEKRKMFPEENSQPAEEYGSPSKKAKSAKSYLDLNEEKMFVQLFSKVLDVMMADIKIAEEKIEKSAYDIRVKFKTYEYMETDFNLFENLFAYYYVYSTVNASISRNRFSLAFDNCTELKTRINTSKVNVISLGGGPGTDLIGFLSAMEPYIVPGKELHLYITIVDLCKRWASFFNVSEFLIREKDFGTVSYVYDRHNVSSCFVTADLKSPENSIKYISDLRNADVVLLVRVLNILSFPDGKDVLDKIVSGMKTGALLIIADTRDNYKCHDGLDILYEADLSEERYALSVSPEKKFNTYPANFATSNIAVCRKC